MAKNNDRIKDALAAYLDYLEVGGPKPGVSHLTPSEQEELNELIGLLDLTEGVAFGLGRREGTEESKPSLPRGVSRPVAQLAGPGQGEGLLSRIREALPADVRIVPDPIVFVVRIGRMQTLDGWTVGTFGGRVRVWLLAAENAEQIEKDRDSLEDLGRVFPMVPDTSAIALVGGDLSCLLVRPEDCAPCIEAPSGSLTSRGYPRPIQPVDEAVAAFLHELIPQWDPIPAFGQDTALSIDVSTMAEESATTAVESQRGIGERAREGNPKKGALLDLGQKEISAITRMACAVYEGTLDPDEVGPRIRRLAKSQ